MPQLRLLEHYTSVQGEGPKVGALTQFVRFAGCNLKCPSWPCDTQEAIDPRLFTKEQRLVTPEDVHGAITIMRRNTGAVNICLTGGEPTVQNHTSLDRLLFLLHYDYQQNFTVEMFSNGTLPYTDRMLQWCNIVMDWKLPGSGEVSEPQTRLRNVRHMSAWSKWPNVTHVIKFTVRDEADLQKALQLYTYHELQKSWRHKIYVGPVYDKMDPADIVEFIKAHELPWKLNLQTHKFIYGNVRSV